MPGSGRLVSSQEKGGYARWPDICCCSIALFALAGRAPATLAPPPPTAAVDPYTGDAAGQMVDEQVAARGVDDPEVLDAMSRVPRHRFVPDQYVRAAYEDHPLPIGYGQTISQPYIVA